MGGLSCNEMKTIFKNRIFERFVARYSDVLWKTDSFFVKCLMVKFCTHGAVLSLFPRSLLKGYLIYNTESTIFETQKVTVEVLGE